MFTPYELSTEILRVKKIAQNITITPLSTWCISIKYNEFISTAGANILSEINSQAFIDTL